MLDLGRHAEFIWASYAVVTLVGIGLVAWLLLQGRRCARDLAALEARGARRRSDATAPATSAAPEGTL